MNELINLGLLLGHTHTHTFKKGFWRFRNVFAHLMEHNFILSLRASIFTSDVLCTMFYKT